MGNDNIKVFNDTKSIYENYFKQQIADSIANQQFYLSGSKDLLSESASPLTSGKEANVLVLRGSTFDTARHFAAQGGKTAALNFASSTTPGGGVLKGSRAQEEALCRCSTLYPCLDDKKCWDLFYNPHRAAKNPLHNDDVIYTPKVMVFKSDDYKRCEPVSIDVISCAAPNLRPKPTNQFNESDGEAVTIKDRDLEELHYNRAKAIFSVAKLHGIKNIIVGAFGCGAFQNDPNVVARGWKRAVEDYKYSFDNIVFGIYAIFPTDVNYATFAKVFEK